LEWIWQIIVFDICTSHLNDWFHSISSNHCWKCSLLFLYISLYPIVYFWLLSKKEQLFIVCINIWVFSSIPVLLFMIDDLDRKMYCNGWNYWVVLNLGELLVPMVTVLVVMATANQTTVAMVTTLTVSFRFPTRWLQYPNAIWILGRSSISSLPPTVILQSLFAYLVLGIVGLLMCLVFIWYRCSNYLFGFYSFPIYMLERFSLSIFSWFVVQLIW